MVNNPRDEYYSWRIIRQDMKKIKGQGQAFTLVKQKGQFPEASKVLERFSPPLALFAQLPQLPAFRDDGKIDGPDDRR